MRETSLRQPCDREQHESVGRHKAAAVDDRRPHNWVVGQFDSGPPSRSWKGHRSLLRFWNNGVWNGAAGMLNTCAAFGRAWIAEISKRRMITIGGKFLSLASSEFTRQFALTRNNVFVSSTHVHLSSKADAPLGAACHLALFRELGTAGATGPKNGDQYAR